MTEITANLYECKHCGGSGTCTNGTDGGSCLVCAKRNELHFWEYWDRKNLNGLLCGSCGGIAKAEPLTERMHKRMPSILALILVIASITIISWAAFFDNKHFSELLPFSSLLIGTVSGYYFSKKEK
jgi:hypothetical protein